MEEFSFAMLTVNNSLASTLVLSFNLEQSSYLIKVSRKVNHHLVIRYEWNTRHLDVSESVLILGDYGLEVLGFEVIVELFVDERCRTNNIVLCCCCHIIGFAPFYFYIVININMILKTKIMD